MTDPLAIYKQAPAAYESAQADIVAIAKRTRTPVPEVAQKMIELRILPVLKEITGGTQQ